MKFIPFTFFAALLAGCATSSLPDTATQEDTPASAFAGGLTGGLLEYAITGDPGGGCRFAGR